MTCLSAYRIKQAKRHRYLHELIVAVCADLKKSQKKFGKQLTFLKARQIGTTKYAFH